MMNKKIAFKYFAFGIAAILAFAPNNATAQIDMAQKPVLVITNKAMPSNATLNNTSSIYNHPVRAPEITTEQISNAAFFQDGLSVVGQKIDGLNKDLFTVQSTVNRLSDQLRSIEANGRNSAAAYYANIATINTQLQTGTTPGNPRLIKNLDTAQINLSGLEGNVSSLNALAVEIADAASKASYLLNTTRSTYNLSGAVEEDHTRLSAMEDQINSAIVSVDRLLNDVNANISRTSSYLSTERNNLRTLSLAVSNGDLYGNSLANKNFVEADRSQLYQQASLTTGPTPQSITPQQLETPTQAAPSARPLAKIRFDKQDVNYEQPVYSAVQNAMNQYPNSRFELVAVHPAAGNAAQVAIESTRSRRNAERVLRTLTQMGVPLGKIDMSYTPSPSARTSEVHLFLR